MVERKLLDELSKTIDAHLDGMGLSRLLIGQWIKEDDWSFVIKSHALVEFLVTDMVVNSLKNDRITQVVSRLELGDKDAGKVALARAIGCLDSTHVRFIQRLSELRNRLVHDARHASFTFSQFVESLDKNQRRAFADSLGCLLNSQVRSGEGMVTRTEFVLRNPKTVIQSSTLILFAESIRTKVQRRGDELRQQILERFLKKSPVTKGERDA
jgi:hypothetical protein